MASEENRELHTKNISLSLINPAKSHTYNSTIVFFSTLHRKISYKLKQRNLRMIITVASQIQEVREVILHFLPVISKQKDVTLSAILLMQVFGHLLWREAAGGNITIQSSGYDDRNQCLLGSILSLFPILLPHQHFVG